MGKKITRSQSNKQDVSDFVDQKLLASDEVCSFGATDIEDLIQKGVFPSGSKSCLQIVSCNLILFLELG